MNPLTLFAKKRARPLSSRLAIHTISLDLQGIENKLRVIAESGFAGVSLWRQDVMEKPPAEIRKLLNEYKLEVASYCRGGFFAAVDANARRSAIYDTERCIDEAEAIGASSVLIIPGADPLQSMDASRAQVREALEKLIPYAEKKHVRMALEAQHPMHADERGCINTLREANDLVEQLGSTYLGVCVDTYQQWWDSSLGDEIARAGENDNLFCYHVADWKTPTLDFLNDRGIPGEGCIELRRISKQVEEAGFDGMLEIEIFSNRWSQDDPVHFLHEVKFACRDYIEPQGGA
ncbi:sugar phosphate isomerase/epimerase family protein [Cerasicoccus fimbriatus]|uniref:sugar phosphate isomerase/epimerase family protein n=1 Tax=Cerasicoccus fimbriatus TaxID=3014554 RepID=UPI0022B4FD9F|nr:sugar phosphate isomerase/epimerase family protein [Cerasicoccus sp. TK19100]